MSKTNSTNLEQMQNALRDVEIDLAAKQAEDMNLKMGLGDALARFRMGEKKAQGEASKISMDRAKLSNEIASLQGEQLALKQRLTDAEAQGSAEHAEALTRRWADIVTEARELEQQIGEQVISTAMSAQRLEQLEREYSQVQRAIIASGAPAALPGRPPAPTAGLISETVIRAPEAAVNNWHHKYGANVRPMNVVRNPMVDAIRAEGRVINQARAEERKQQAEGRMPRIIVNAEDRSRPGVA